MHSGGAASAAITALNDLTRHADDRDTLLALINFSREGADIPSALAYAQRLACIGPSDPNVVRLKEDLEKQQYSQTMTATRHGEIDLTTGEGLGGTLQEASNHLRRVPRQIRAYLPRHTAIEERGAVRLFFRFGPSHWHEG